MIIDDTTLPLLHLHATAVNNYRTFYIFTNPGDVTVKLYKSVYLYFLYLPTCKWKWRMCLCCSPAWPFSFFSLIPVKNSSPLSLTPVKNSSPVSAILVSNCHRYQRHRWRIIHRYQRLRWVISHRCRWHRWQNCKIRSIQWALKILTAVAED